MLLHTYTYRLKCITRARQMMFWTLLFPILLSIFFYMAFSNLSSAETFSKIKMAVINDDAFKNDTNFKTALEGVSDPSVDDSLFDVTYTTKEDGEKLLNDGKVKGFIYLDNDINLVVKKTGLEQTIMKEFIDDYKQTSSTVTTIMSQNPQAMQNGLMDTITTQPNYLKEVTPSKAKLDIAVNYFYTLIGMACMYGGFLGMNEVIAVQANLSAQGARVNMAPTHKLKVCIMSLLAAATVQLFDVAALLAFLVFVLHVNFGTQIGYILLTCLVGTLTGVSFGSFIGSVVKGGLGIKIGMLIGSSMLMAYLSGMMYDKMKYIIATQAPIVGYLNPSSLITDCFYSLYYYDTHTVFFRDIFMLCGFIVFFSLVTYFILRRQKYASL